MQNTIKQFIRTIVYLLLMQSELEDQLADMRMSQGETSNNLQNLRQQLKNALQQRDELQRQRESLQRENEELVTGNNTLMEQCTQLEQVKTGLSEQLKKSKDMVQEEKEQRAKVSNNNRSEIHGFWIE